MTTSDQQSRGPEPVLHDATMTPADVVAPPWPGELPSAIVNAMSIDVEDYFQVSAFEQHVQRHDWESFELRVERNTHRMLDLFAGHGVKATFFTLGWVAERCPSLVRRIVDDGHELASHGWDHRRVTTLTPADFAADVLKTRQCLEDCSGTPVVGYRAPSYSITRDNLWAHRELADAGYRYSSSIAPVQHDHYGIPDAPRFPFLSADRRLLEVPVSTVSMAGRNLACGGGGWFRFYPYAMSRSAMRWINHVDGQPAVFYLHPWEIDPEQPRIAGLDRKTRFRHYVNLPQTYARLDRLCQDFRWDRMDAIYLDAPESIIERLNRLHPDRRRQQAA